MPLVTGIYGVATLTTMSTKFSIAVESKILIFLIWKTHFSETNVLGLTQFTTERACNSRITIKTSMINIRNKKLLAN